MLIKPTGLQGDRFEIIGSEREKMQLEREFPKNRICGIRIAGSDKTLLSGRPKFTLNDEIKKTIILVLVDRNGKPISLSLLLDKNTDDCYYILE